ncbi:MAG: 3-phytase [Ponticaulis sp.]|nr:3-phytase [Ponticaulis sp.]|tara:strand:+ start:6378 stop:7445 length:1068 start_codon:yes stop_codon:yes gene_type:complete
MISRIALLASLGLVTACASMDPNKDLPKVMPLAETEEVASTGDAADDPAIWVNPDSPEESRVLGTDKQAGLYVYDLSGKSVQFLPKGELNNVDLRQGVDFGTGELVDLAAATNRSINGVSLFLLNAEGVVSEAGDFSVPTTEPYGLCVGYDQHGYRVFVTYKTGEVEIHTVSKSSAGLSGYEAELSNTLKLATQLEGCTYDEVQSVLFVGEEATGVWRIALNGNEEIGRSMIDAVDSETGLVADVEGMDLWRGETNTGYLVVSAQEGDRYLIYERTIPNRWVATFAIDGTPDELIDGVSHTDGLTVTSSPLGPDFPQGMLVVQDDSNGNKGQTQNFKFISWADLLTALSAQKIAE